MGGTWGYLCDLCLITTIIFDFHAQYHDIYPSHKLYRTLLEKIENPLKELEDWDFHNHLDEDENPNKYHPIHIRMPMVDLFHGTKTSEEQVERFKEKISEVLLIIKECDEFWMLRNDLPKKI